jgi:trigger factor
METTLTQLQDNLVSVSMIIPAAEATSAYNTAATRISQYINVDGFRKGKAPRAVVERHVGVDRICQEALDILLPKYLNQAIHDNNLDVITQPAITSYKFETGKDVEVVFEVETRPEVSLGSFKGLNVKVEIPSAEDSAFDKALEGFLTQHASLELVLDRASEPTDIVVFDFEGKCNGELIQGGSAKGYTLDLAHSNFIPGFAEQLVGHNIKDEFDIQVTFPEEYHDEKLKGQPATFSIKLNEIKKRVLPELTDEFVKKSSSFSTVDELKADIQSYIDSQRESIKKINAENTVFKAILDASSVDIPQGMINREIESLKVDYQQRLSAQGVDWNAFVQSQGDDFEKSLTENATSRIKNSLIIDKISKEAEIKVEQADFQTKISQVAGAYGVGPQDLMKQFGQNPNFLTTLSQQIVNDKVRDYLLSNNNIEYVEVKPEAQSVEA